MSVGQSDVNSFLIKKEQVNRSEREVGLSKNDIVEKVEPADGPPDFDPALLRSFRERRLAVFKGR